jgi:hypothetical protein
VVERVVEVEDGALVEKIRAELKAEIEAKVGARGSCGAGGDRVAARSPPL